MSLINREMLLEEYDRAHKGPPGGARKLIAEAPAVEAEPVRHGRWINDTFCSECKRFPVDVSVSISNQELTKYFSRCPHCGARMDATDTNVGGKGGEQE